MNSLILELPFPPTVNTYRMPARFGKTTRLITSKKGREYKKTISDILLTIPYKCFDKNIIVKLVLNPPDKRKRDVDNYSKALLDALTDGSVWTDDSLIKKLIIEMDEPVKHGSVCVMIEEMANELP